MIERRSGQVKRFLRAPETNVAIFAFLLNLPWEMWQVPLFRGMATAPHWDVVWICTGAAVGDAAIAVVSFWVVAVVGSHAWILRPSRREVAVFMAAGVAITVVLEWSATRLLDRWEYMESMPTLPVLGIGIVPLLQWIVLPPLIVWFVRRQLT